MANKLYVNLNMFSLNQSIFFSDGDKEPVSIASVPIESVGETLASFSANAPVDEIEIHGNKDYIKQALYDLKYSLETTYKNNKNVRIFANGEVCN